MIKNIFSFSGIKDKFQHASLKEDEQVGTSTNSAESSTSNQGLVMPDWCGNPESCMTDCHEYCEKLHSDSSNQALAMPSWCANPESCMTDCHEYCEKLHS